MGGADVVVTHVDGFELSLTGELPALIVRHLDRPGVIAGVTGALATDGANIANLADTRAGRGAEALMVVETDAAVSDETAARVLSLDAILAVRRVPSV